MSDNQNLCNAAIVKELTNLLDDGYLVRFAKGHGVIIIDVTDDGKQIAAARQPTLSSALEDVYVQVPPKSKG